MDRLTNVIPLISMNERTKRTVELVLSDHLTLNKWFSQEGDLCDGCFCNCSDKPVSKTTCSSSISPAYMDHLFTLEMIILEV